MNSRSVRLLILHLQLLKSIAALLHVWLGNPAFTGATWNIPASPKVKSITSQHSLCPILCVMSTAFPGGFLKILLNKT